MNRYVELPREAIEVRLQDAGFKPVFLVGSNELTYERQHLVDPRVTIRVYTSVHVRGWRARGKGTDAIRVIAVFAWTHRATKEKRRKVIFKAKVLRVNSVPSIVERTIERCRDAYRAGNEFLRGNESIRERAQRIGFAQELPDHA